MYIEREIKEKFQKIEETYPIIALVGARQCGKTTFLKENSKKFKASYLLFDDPDVRTIFENDIKKFENQYIEGFELSILDEVQYCKDAGRNLKYLADKNKRLWITSSSEMILGKEVLSYLVGRVSILKLYPFSINEFLKSKKQKEITEGILERHVLEHINFGGYPKVVQSENIELKKIILKDLYDTMILKDIAKTFLIENINSLEEFSRYLSLIIGGVISYENISKEINLSFQTIKKYLDAMEKSYLISRAKPFHTNKIKEITKQPKIYFIDTGLRNIIAKNFDVTPSGQLFENYVYSELLKFGFEPKYWRTKSGAEVDFVVDVDGQIIPIEVKAKADNKVSKSLRSFIDNYNPKRAFVVSYKNKQGKININNCEVMFLDILSLKKQLKKD
ncbi:ATP-binding protein [Candidatus Pacearchaeota archaeon]|nr:ATP-binding protein [Candidatus Pacearchaeota archaeon]